MHGVGGAAFQAQVWGGLSASLLLLLRRRNLRSSLSIAYVLYGQMLLGLSGTEQSWSICRDFMVLLYQELQVFGVKGPCSASHTKG